MNKMISGVDLSKLNGTVDFKKLKDNYNFVILRAGYGNDPSYKDVKFEEYYKLAKEAKLEIGCFWTSYAKTDKEAKKEAEAFLEVIKDKDFSFPCYLNFENENLIKRSTKATLTNIVNKWCGEVEKAGYKAGYYIDYSFINKFNQKEIKYEKWLSKYTSNIEERPSEEFGLWQYAIMGNSSDSTILGKVLGCDECSSVDINYSFKNYPKIIGVSFA